MSMRLEFIRQVEQANFQEERGPGQQDHQGDHVWSNHLDEDRE